MHSETAKLFEIHYNFPQPGIRFIDISPLFLNPDAYRYVLDEMKTFVSSADGIIGVDARGFLFAAPIAQDLRIPLILTRKSGKLPGELISTEAKAEYSKESYFIRKGVITPGSRIVIVDDILATGNTAAALVDLATSEGAIVECIFLGEILSLNGRSKVPNSRVVFSF